MSEGSKEIEVKERYESVETMCERERSEKIRLVKDRCVIVTPLGKPEVPEV